MNASEEDEAKGIFRQEFARISLESQMTNNQIVIWSISKAIESLSRRLKIKKIRDQDD